MNEILITLLMLGAGYYLLIHQQKQPITINHSQSTQTEPFANLTNQDDKDLARTLDNLITNIRQLNHSLK